MSSLAHRSNAGSPAIARAETGSTTRNGSVSAAAIEARGLSKRFGDVLAVDGLSFQVPRGTVVGFLGPNGAGKTTTLRMLLGLIAPSEGVATINGRRYGQLPSPSQAVGAVLDASGGHPGRSARNHLRVHALATGSPATRVGEVLELVELSQAADRRIGGFSLGMRQRLGLATALLCDPRILILDEPGNGLDPEGVRWLRGLLRGLAAEGRTVLVSSHLINEMALTAEQLVVIGRGTLIAETSVGEFVGRNQRESVRVVTPKPQLLVSALTEADVRPTVEQDGAIVVSGLSSAEVGALAAAHALTLHELAPLQATLEDAFMELTSDAVVYRSQKKAEDAAAHPVPVS